MADAASAQDIAAAKRFKNDYVQGRAAAVTQLNRLLGQANAAGRPYAAPDVRLWGTADVDGF